MTAAVSLAEQKDPVSLESLPVEAQARVQEIASQISISDSQGIVGFGVGAQREISDFSDTILNEVRSKDTGPVGEILTDLVVKVKDLDIDNLSGNPMSKIPFIGSLWDSFKKFTARYQKLSVQIEKIIDELDKSRMGLLKDITLLDAMFEKNNEYLKNLDLFIIAGKLKLQELQEKLLPELKSKADESQDPADSQKYQDAAQFVNRLDKKVHDLLLSRMISIQTAPQIRLVQNGNQELVEKIQSSILNTIPLWKNQIVIAITLYRQKNALQLQKEVSDTTNDLLKKNAEMLKQGSVDIARESQRGIVDIETLKKTNADLISTIEQTLQIQKEGRQKRLAAESELKKMEGDLKAKLKENVI